jgi:Tfp pilus assembly protein PilN
MRAVNLIPAEQQRGGGAGGAGRTGGAVYVLLGGLAVVVIALAAWVLTNNAITDHKAELAKVNKEANIATAQAATLRPFREFAQLRVDRVLTVQSLARSRFDWQRAFTDLARVIPSDVWLTSMVATVKPGVSFGGTGGGAPDSGDTGQLRGSLQVPAIELVGCTLDQAEVARVMTRLRLITGVQRVSLASSIKSQTAVVGNAASATSSAGGASGASDDCRHGSRKFPKFSLVIFFKATPASTLPSTSGGSTPQGAATTPPTAGQAGARAASTGGASQ